MLSDKNKPKNLSWILFKNNWPFLFIIFYPIVLCPIIIYWKTPHKEAEAAYILSLMIGLWVTEAMPLPITSALPIVIVPLFGIMDTGAVTSLYMNDTILFLFAGLFISLAIEYSDLHSRIALKVILCIGTRIPRLMLGLMLCTMFLSCWMNNVSAVTLMIPICNAILDQIKKKMLSLEIQRLQQAKIVEEVEKVEDGEDKSGDVFSNSKGSDAGSNYSGSIDLSGIEGAYELEEDINKIIHKYRVMMLIGIGWSATCGGTGIISGTSSNLVAIAHVNEERKSVGDYDRVNNAKCKEILEISFFRWIIFTIFPMIITILCGFIILYLYHMGIPQQVRFWEWKIKLTPEEKQIKKDKKIFQKNLDKAVKKSIKVLYSDLGGWSFHQIAVVIHLTVTVLLWALRRPLIIPGWGDLFDEEVNDTTSTVGLAIILFIIPRKKAHYVEFFRGGLGRGLKKPLLDFKFAMKRFPWSLIFILGGGNSLGNTLKTSGLTERIAEGLHDLWNHLDPRLVAFMVSILVIGLTAISSNTTTANIMVPIVLSLSIAEGIHPLYLVLITTVLASYDFILPIGTPPNTICYEASEAKPSDMIIPGIFVTICGVGAVLLTTHTISEYYFQFSGYTLNPYCSKK